MAQVQGRLSEVIEQRETAVYENSQLQTRIKASGSKYLLLQYSLWNESDKVFRCDLDSGVSADGLSVKYGRPGERNRQQAAADRRAL